MNGIEKTIAHFKSLSGVARALNLSGYQVVQQWRESGRVPAEYCPKIEELTEGEVRCEELNDRVNWAYLRQTSVASTAVG
ncbi:transcriptional regulator [Herbaspirillum rubrisubalbicans]|uniref:Cro/Cl family transcriptional regulator n=1 Tax=Herbaspirillum rubrisubalbicans TaxID=80842 RepID=A0AAD0UG19_9BURK|nr:YdaS family helix-turn-helix protein [Herbaspirillum rubrisubalbicans]AYR26905.1 Cro/Cl family transcriptional regulator [Herbaspirillum rubrisubalbicans]